MRTRLLASALAAAALLSACGSDAAESSTADTTAATTAAVADEMAEDEMSEDSMADEMSEDEMSEDSMADEMADDAAMPELAAWQQLELTDVDGTAFTLAEFVGKPVFVENMATWCPNCRKQLEKTNTAAAELGDEAIVLALSVETDLSAGDLAAYAEENAFDNIRFAVMTPEFLVAITEAFGNPAITPPSTPHFVIDRHGVPGELVTGFEEPAALVEAVQSAAA